MIDIVSGSDCVGCKACGDICPVEAISYKTDEEGFWYPEVNRDVCVNCGLCEKTCPALACHYASGENRKEPKTYKAYHKDKKIRYNSTSGALYYALAETFIREGGYIVGCVYSEDYSRAYHYISNTMEGLWRIMRSKYFQSDTEGIYRNVRQLLDEGRKVFFCGTPCQVSALYGFLRKDYRNLFTVDFICLGINTPLAFQKFTEELKQRYRSDIAEVHLKNKLRGWTNLGTMVTFKNGRKLYRGRDNDPWVNAFVVGRLYMRPSCSNCRYKGFPRVSDISMGDFWGIRYTKEEEKLGVSVALINTDKGDELLKCAEKDLVLEKRRFQEAVEGNPALIQPVAVNPRRGEFFQRIRTEPYSRVVWSILGSNALKRQLKVIKDRTRRLLKRTLR